MMEMISVLILDLAVTADLNLPEGVAVLGAGLEEEQEQMETAIEVKAKYCHDP